MWQRMQSDQDIATKTKPIPPELAPIPIADSMRKTTLVVCVIAAFINPFIVASLNIALPSMARDLSLNAVTIPWVLTILLLSSSIVMLPMGRIADIYGRKKIFLWGWVLFSVTSLLVTFAVNGTMLLTLRAIQGISVAMFVGPIIAIVTSVYPRDQRGRVLGLIVTAQYAGSSVGPVVGGILTQNLGWRSIFLAMVPMALGIALLITTRLKTEWADARGEKFDMVGSVIYGVSLALIMYGVALLPNAIAFGPMLAGGVVFAVFVRWESRAASPVLNLELFKGNRVFLLGNLAAFINFGASGGVALLLSLYLQNIKGFSPQNAGLIMLAQPIVQALLSTWTGHLSDQMNPHRLSSLGMGITATALFLFSRLDMETPVWAVILITMLLAVGFAFFATPNMNIVMGTVEKKYYGVASAVVNTMRQLGTMFSSGLTATIFAIIIGPVAITPAVSPLLMTSTSVAFMLFFGVCVIGIFVSLGAGKGHARLQPTNAAPAVTIDATESLAEPTSPRDIPEPATRVE